MDTQRAGKESGGARAPAGDDYPGMPEAIAPVVTACNHRAPEHAVVNQVILKIVQRCNLDCTYCYVYNRGDDSWKSRPPVISERVLLRLAERINEHCRRHALSSFTIELHGGEPLLIGKRKMQALLTLLRSRIDAAHVRFTMQTNGLLLDPAWIDLLAQHQVSFGISLDGPPALADRYRIQRKDRSGSTQQLLDIIAQLRSEGPLFDQLFGGCLCVVNPDIDGGELVDWFVAQGVDAFDFLLPDGNRLNPPQGWTGVAPYRRFLLSAFERWHALGASAPRIRKFELMMSGLLGGKVFLDALGGDLRLLCVLESDGSIGVSDVTRICGGEYANDVLNIFDHALDEHVRRYRIDEVQQVCGTCRACPHLASCGGGYLPHRFNGIHFANPSIYCEALYAVSARMTQLLHEHLPAGMLADMATPALPASSAASRVASGATR
ncbi:radical SAM protein [Actimicrobium sp. CCC2.4]|uniref:radical SAM protein n=1 Tax=Actimicrobium sp. CCC2.4 TaxID=3048606 RepID=UPI002AC8AACE|nr:radical SAM protein [Actimicrobium sp. CCC2.4]MEB0136893.1 radical SAM protein [Actimicrobium sp. CCC2.4]WPX33443.1 radical SAM protein [Actimicrobium sp. CCC2.4]